MYSEAAQPSFRDIVPEDAVVEQVSAGHLFTEGPVWDKAGYLWVSDETINKIYKVTTATGEKQEIISLGEIGRASCRERV